MNGAQTIVKILRQSGIDQVFGYPGGAIMPLYDALYDGGLAHQLCRHEQGAAIAAIGYARSSGKTGVCIATSGPGATNLITGLAEAMMDSVPVVAITGQVAREGIGTDAFQEVDVLGLTLACTKHSWLVTDPAELPEVMQQALQLANSGRPGPVLIDVPKDIQLGDIPAYVLSEPETGSNTLDSDALQQAQSLLANAKRPILYAGGGVGLAGACPELAEFLATTGMPSVATLKGMGAVDPYLPQYLGMLGMHGSQAANLAVQECDLLVVAGARFDDRVTGKLDAFAPHAKVLHLDIDEAEIDKRRLADVALQADLTLSLPALKQPLSIDDWQQRCGELKAQYQLHYGQSADYIHAPSLLRELSNRLPKNAVVASDVGQHQMWVAQHMRFSRPENHLSSSGLGTMGFGLPAAIGAQFARPNDPVVLVSGDGSIMMNIQELGTIKRAGLPLKIVLLDNQRLGMVRQWQTLFFDGRYSETTLDDNPDFVTLASAFNIPGERIDQSTQIDAALERLTQSEGPYLLHVRIPSDGNVWPLVPPNASNEQMLETL